MQKILDYFPGLSPQQQQQFAQLEPLYKEWNAKINVISRKDIDNLYLHHVLHSLAIAKVVQFVPGARIMDLGTGGGFPGIPLAILFPEVSFFLIDGTGKKITVVKEVTKALGLKNVTTRHGRAEELKDHFDFVTCRAVASLDKLINWSAKLIKKKQQHAQPNGLLALKGGDIDQEINALPNRHYTECYPLSGFFMEDFFEGKYLVYVQG